MLVSDSKQSFEEMRSQTEFGNEDKGVMRPFVIAHALAAVR